MTPERDYTGRWRLAGHEQHSFTTEADARSAAAVARDHAKLQIALAMMQESRYRRAAKRAQNTAKEN
jgi:hypothetical protein